MSGNLSIGFDGLAAYNLKPTKDGSKISKYTFEILNSFLNQRKIVIPRDLMRKSMFKYADKRISGLASFTIINH